MTKEEKELLLRDLCARSPYGVKCRFKWSFANETTDYEEVTTEEDDTIKSIYLPTMEVEASYYGELVSIEDCRPYLRSMGSMTEEEKAELSITVDKSDYEMDDTTMKNGFIIGIALGSSAVIDYLLSNHFDFLGLISKNLAIEVTKDTYKEK